MFRYFKELTRLKNRKLQIEKEGHEMKSAVPEISMAKIE